MSEQYLIMSFVLDRLLQEKVISEGIYDRTKKRLLSLMLVDRNDTQVGRAA